MALNAVELLTETDAAGPPAPQVVNRTKAAWNGVGNALAFGETSRVNYETILVIGPEIGTCAGLVYL